MSSVPSPPGRRLRWGLGDVLWVWFAGLAAAVVLGSIAQELRGRGPSSSSDGIDLAIGLFAQNGAMLAALVGVSHVKGLGTLRADFGLVVHARDWPWLAAGVLLQVVGWGFVTLLEEVAGGMSTQEAARTVERTTGPELFFVVVGVAVLAPVVEELLFRGLLLRALLRRTSPVAAVLISSAVFAAAHLLDWSTWPLMGPLLLLAVVSAIRALRSGTLSQSILLHVGFNVFAIAFLAP